MIHNKLLHQLILVFLAVMLAIPNEVSADDAIINCSGGECTFGSETRLFNEPGVFPGDSVSQSLTIENDLEESIEVVLEVNITQDSGLAEALDLQITHENNEIHPVASLASVSTERDLTLSEITPGAAATYLFTVTIDQELGNQYQGKKTMFDFEIHITGIDSQDSLVLSATDVESDSNSIPSVLSNVITLPLTGNWQQQSAIIVIGAGMLTILGVVIKWIVQRFESK